MNAPQFQAGQVWTLKPELSPVAKVVIERIEPRRYDTVAHVRIIELPGHPRAAEGFQRMDLFSPHPPQPDRPAATTFLISGFGSFEDWYGGSAVIDIRPDAPDGAVSIPHVVLFERDLREAVGKRLNERRELSEWFDTFYRLWTEAEASSAELNDADLARPLAETLTYAARQTAGTVEQWLVPVPPPAPASGEMALDDPAFSSACNEWMEAILSQLGEGIGASRTTTSAAFGRIWRGDRIKQNAAAGTSVDRALCWMPAGAQKPEMAFAWSQRPLS